MSSYYTTVSVLDSEWTRMQQDIADARAYRLRTEEEITRLRRLEEERRSELARIQNENRQTINSTVDYINTTFNANLNQLSADVRTQITDIANTIERQIEGVRTQAAQLNARIGASSAAVDNIARQYNNVFQNMINNMQQAKDRAESILAELDHLLERIRGLNPQVFAPSEYYRLEAMRTNTASNIRSGNYQAAIFAAQDGILEASRTLVRLVATNERYNAQYSDIRNRFNELQGRIDILASEDGRITLEIGEETRMYDYDVSRWSRGEFDVITSEVRTINEQLENAANKPIAMDALIELGRGIDQLNERLSQCDNQARQNMAGTITALDTASRINERLAESGWELVSSGHVDADPTKPYTIVYDDGFGNHVSFVVSAGKDPKKPELNYEAFADDKPTEEVIKDGIRAVIGDAGLQMNNIQHRNDCASNTTPEIFINNVIQH